MNEITKRDWLIRIFVGGPCGLLFQCALATLLRSAFTGSFHFAFFTQFGSHAFTPTGELLWNLCNTALMFAFGAEIGVATLPFDDDGKTLLRKSAAHFAVMALTVSLWSYVNFQPATIFFFLKLLAVIYTTMWLLRYLRWRLELNAIKKKLGLIGKGRK